MTSSFSPDSMTAERIGAALAEADRLSQSGRARQAEQICREILGFHPNLPAALNLLALILRDRGAMAEAEGLLRKAIAAAPREAALYNNLGNLQRMMGNNSAAEETLRSAIEIQPAYPEAFYNLGLVLTALGRDEEALASHRNAVTMRSNYAAARVQVGLLLRRMGNADDALRAFDTAIAVRPDYFDAFYYRSDLLAALERYDDALEAIGKALQIRPQSIEAMSARANILVRARRDEEALDQYRKLLELAPHSLHAHREYNALAWQMGRHDLNLKSYAVARARVGDTPDLLFAEASQRLRQNEGEPAEHLLRRAHDLSPERGDVSGALGRALTLQKRYDEAAKLFEQLIKSSPQDVQNHRDMAIALLHAGEAKEAAEILEKARAIAPYDQLILAHLAAAWRETGDGRLGDLVDHDKYVRAYDIPAPSNFMDVEAFNRALGEELLGLHSRRVEPVDQSLRGGTQTVGDLFSERSKAIVTFRESIDAAIADYVRSLPNDPSHPFAGRKAERLRYNGAWSCNLREGGYHNNHVHHLGWISSAYYVALPDATKDTKAHQGWLKFGESNIGLGERDRPEKLMQPTVGKLVLFPSYYWHGTMPFASDKTRLTVAFDAVPMDESLRRA